jgi:hypothetical protein
MEGYTIYTEAIFAIEEDLTSKMWYLKTQVSERHSIITKF